MKIPNTFTSCNWLVVQYVHTANKTNSYAATITWVQYIFVDILCQNPFWFSVYSGGEKHIIKNSHSIKFFYINERKDIRGREKNRESMIAAMFVISGPDFTLVRSISESPGFECIKWHISCSAYSGIFWQLRLYTWCHRQLKRFIWLVT